MQFRNIIAVILGIGLALPLYAQAPAEDEIEMLPPIDATAPVESSVEEIIGEEVTNDWILPTSGGWWSSPLWEFGAELGINGSSGNSDSLSVLTSGSAKRETDVTKLTLDFKYGKTETNGLETQHFALFDGRWDWTMSKLTLLYLQNSLEYDEFKAFDLRLAVTGGFGYHLAKTEATTLTGRLGAGTSREFGGPDDDWVPEANAGLDFEHKISKRQKLNFQTDFYPSWEDFQDYRLVKTADWEILLDEAHNLSLKLGAVDRYDSTPNGRKHNDVDYYVTLLWKM